MTPRLSAEARREQILAAVLPVVLDHGLTITTRRLAEAAGVAEGTLFRSFDDKEALLRAVLERELFESLSCEGLAERFETVEALVDAAMGVLVPRFARMSRATAALGSLIRPEEPEIFRRFVRLHEEVAGRFTPFAAQLRVGTDAAAELLLSLCSTAGTRWGTPGRRASPGEIRAVLLHGLVDEERRRAR